MKIAVLLPHTLLFGGIKHHLEIGETCIARGHEYTVFSPDGAPPEWFPFSGRVRPLAELTRERHDVVLTSEEEFLDAMAASGARVKIFHVINENRALRRIARHRDVILVANSTRSYRRVLHTLGRAPFKAFGGVNTDDFFPRAQPLPERPFVVMTYGRQSMKRKGTHLVKAACERLHRRGFDVRMLLFDTLVTEAVARDHREFRSTCPYDFVVGHPVRRNHELYHRAHVFASAERKGAWANTAAEAMACGIPVVASSVGSEDFLLPGRTGLRVPLEAGAIERAIARLYHDPGLRERLAAAGLLRIARFQWRFMADQLLALCERADPLADQRSEWPYEVNRVRAIRLRPPARRAAAQALPPGVYVVNYHAIVDDHEGVAWERGLTEFATRRERFERHVEWLRERAEPVALADVPALLAAGPPDRARVAITFDDGFASVRTAALPVLARAGMTATAFVNTAYADGGVSPLVLLAELARVRGFATLARELKRRFGLALRKPRHAYRALKSGDGAPALRAWLAEQGQGLIRERVHLDWDDLRALVAAGWAVGNHTASHPLLAALTYDEQAAEIEAPIAACARHGVPLLKWLAYPFGGPEHVSPATLTWMSARPDWHGTFCNGGVNLAPSRTEVLRIGVADPDVEDFAGMLLTAARVSAAARDRAR